MEILTKSVINVLHVLFILFVILAPFSGSNYMMVLQIIILPFIMVHWALEDHTCSIVFVEKKINTLLFNYNKKGFFANLIEPVYDFKKDYKIYATYIYIITIILWGLSIRHLYMKYKNGKINNMNDLFT